MTGDSARREALSATVGAFVDELIRAGVRHFCVCPGSRSTPLALTIARHPATRGAAARLWMHIDERSAGFFALGLAKAAREPVALVCTSGTAAANFLPAVVEAFYGRVPLVVLTADRPHELRDRGAPQTIDQPRLFGTHVKWFFDLPLPEASGEGEEEGEGEALRHVRTVADRAAATARGEPAGPVHVNCPYREPLIPSPLPGAGAAAGEAVGRGPWASEAGGPPLVTVAQGARTLDPALVQTLAATLEGARRGLLVCGPQDDPGFAAALACLAEATGYAVLADPLSLARCGPHDRGAVIDAYDAFLRDAAFVGRAEPELVIRFGALPTSKPLLLYLQRYRGCAHILVDGSGGWNDPAGLATEIVHADGRLLCAALAGQCRRSGTGAAPGWLAAWRAANQTARAAIAARLAGLDELFEGKVFAELGDLLPDGAVLYVGNSMPVRDLDTFFGGSGRAVRFLANRGANGIDGVVSSALGAAAAGRGRPLVLVIGDLSFYHDANGLLAAKQHGLDATIVLLNNDGGGIFSFLPQADDPEHFEALFGTPHGLDFRPLAETYGATFTRVACWDEFRRTVRRGMERGGLAVVEVPTERRRNVTLHREVWQAVSRALAQPAEAGHA